MAIIKIETFIRAPITLCFDLARDVDIHTQTTSKTKERAVAGVTEGLLEEGDMVTWEAIHFGFTQRLTAKISEMRRPFEFTDVQVTGAFRSFTHQHRFVESNEGTIMIDSFEYKAPFGIFGLLADRLFLKRYMEKFLIQRALELKRIAEERTDDQKEVWEKI